MTLMTRLQQYVDDVATLVSTPKKLLPQPQDGDSDEALFNALVFLVISALVSALLDIPSTDVKSPNLWVHAWESFRVHIFPLLLFVICQTLSLVLLWRLLGHQEVRGRRFFLAAAWPLGGLVVVSSTFRTLAGQFFRGPTFAIDIGTILLLLFILNIVVVHMLRADLRFKFILPVTVVISTLAGAYVAGRFESAVGTGDYPRPGVFMPLVAGLHQFGSPNLGVTRSSNVPSQTQPFDTAAGPAGQPRSNADLVLGTDIRRRGRLDLSDQIEGDKFVDRIALEVRSSGEGVTIQVASTQFDTYALLLSPAGDTIAQNDDEDGPFELARSTNSRIDAILPDSGVYTIVVSSYAPYETGEYDVMVEGTLAMLVPPGWMITERNDFGDMGYSVEAAVSTSETTAGGEATLGAYCVGAQAELLIEWERPLNSDEGQSWVEFEFDDGRPSEYVEMTSVGQNVRLFDDGAVRRILGRMAEVGRVVVTVWPSEDDSWSAVFAGEFAAGAALFGRVADACRFSQ